MPDDVRSPYPTPDRSSRRAPRIGWILRPPTVVIGVLAVLALAPRPVAALLRPPFYSARSIQATVVDEATRRPVEGVVVVAIWELSTISGRGHVLQISETVTDAQGKFSLPGFGPRLRPPLHEARERMPYLVFFKHGYVPLSLENASRDKFVALFGDPREWSTRQLRANLPFEFDAERVVQESFWNGLTIELEPFRGTPARWLELLRVTKAAIDPEDRKRARRLFQALLGEETYFATTPPDPSTVRPADLRAFFLEIRSYLE
jgi:hypothetical protein